MPMRFKSLLSKLPLFSGRSSAELDSLLEGADDLTLKHRERLFCMGERAPYFYIVVQGALKLMRNNSEGHDIILHFATPGDLVGAVIMLKVNSVYPIDCVSMGPSAVLRIPRATYLKSWVTNPAMQTYLGENIFSRMNQMHNEKVLRRAPLAQKIANQLVTFIEHYAGENDTLLPIPLTRQEIADAVGASVESVIRVMSGWSREGIISTADQLIRVERMDKILEILKGTEPSAD